MPDSRRRRPRNASAEILDAAYRVVARDGAGRLTIDAVARETGITKGGVLYNFPSKNALLEGMLAQLVDTFAAKVTELSMLYHDKPNATLRAYVAACDHLEEFDPALKLAILAAAAENPEMLKPIRKLGMHLEPRIIAEAADPEMAIMIICALDGMMFQQMIDLRPEWPSNHVTLRARIEKIIDEMEPKT